VGARGENVIDKLCRSQSDATRCPLNGWYYFTLRRRCCDAARSCFWKDTKRGNSA
jgi:hypothetical protein